MPTSYARTLKSPRRLQRRRDRRSPSPQWQFLRGFFKNPVMVGSIIPSSRVLIDKMLEPVDWANTRLFVEYGPGVGTFTRPLLERLGPDATLVTIDTNADFTRYLKERIDDPRLVAVTGSAADVEKILADRNFGQADYVLSGLPFSTLPPPTSSAPEARSWSISSARRCSISSSRTSRRSSAGSSGSTCRPRPCSGAIRASQKPNLPAGS
jgi:phospholipid N-methyltransferase